VSQKMEEPDLILTYDIGTTGNKCSLFDLSGKILGYETILYKTDYLRPGWSQQNPENYWESVIKGTKSLGSRYPDLKNRVCCIGLSGHMNGMLALDSSGNPLYPEIIHSDNRAEEFCKIIRERISDSDFYNITGNRIDVHLSLPKILWFKKNYPDLYQKTRWFIQSKDFIAGRLTGAPGKTDFSDASLTCLLDLKARTWSHDILKLTGIEADKLPDPCHSHDKAGELSKEAANLLGLARGLPVFVGGGDAACSARGAGLADYRTAQNYIGSSSWISVLSPAPMMDAGRRVQNFYDLDGTSINVCGTVQCAGIALDWIIDQIVRFPGHKEEVYELCETLAQQSKPGSDGLLFLPYMMGERTPYWNSYLKGSFVGLSLKHGKSQLCRAVFEGVSMALRDVLDVFLENGQEISWISLTGGGAQSRFWNQMMSDVYERPVRIPHSPKQTTSLGAAMAAGVGMKIYKSYNHAAKLVSAERELIPHPVNKKIYKSYHKAFSSIYSPYARMTEILSGINDPSKDDEEGDMQ